MVTSYERTFFTLRDTMSNLKNQAECCANFTNQNHYNPRHERKYLILLCPTDVALKKYIRNNFQYQFLSNIIYSVSSGNSSTLRSVFMQEMISTDMGLRSRTLLMYSSIHSVNKQDLLRWMEFLQSCTNDLAIMQPSNMQGLLVESRFTKAVSIWVQAADMFKKKKRDKKGLILLVVAQYEVQHPMSVLTSFTTSLNHKETPHKSMLKISKSLNDLLSFLSHDNLVSSDDKMRELFKFLWYLDQLKFLVPYMENMVGKGKREGVELKEVIIWLLVCTVRKCEKEDQYLLEKLLLNTGRTGHEVRMYQSIPECRNSAFCEQSDIDCSQYLLRSGDVETNPGPRR